MKMKELEARTGTNRESIRYYIREGLLPPAKKLKRNVAEYGPEHVERTQLIKRLQDEHFLPLKVVKEVLGKVSDESVLTNLSRPALSKLLPELIHDTPNQTATTVTELAIATGLDQTEIRAMSEVGAISIQTNDEILARDAEIASLWAQARAAGFTAERGYGMEFLQQYVALAEQWAKQEAELYLKVFSNTPDDETAEAGAKGLEIGGNMVALMHTNAVLKMISTLAAPKTDD